MPTTVTYTEGLIRRAIFRWWVRFIAWHGFAWAAIWSALCVGLVIWQADTWLIYGSLVVWVFAVGVAWGVYAAYVRRSLSKFRQMNNPTAEVTISNDEFRLKNSLGDIRLQWRVIEAIWRFPEAWLMFGGKNAFFTLPINAISTEDRELMCAKVKEHGGKIV